MMVRQLNPREGRMLLVGLVLAGAILVLTYGAKGIDRWSRSRSALADAKKKLADVETDKTKLAGLLSLVPVFETPGPEEKQKSLFREKLYEQLKKAGVSAELQPPLLGKRLSVGGATYRVLKIKCKAKGKFDQLLDFLANLKENPYFVGVEELYLRCDTKEPPEKRKDKIAEIDLVVSTLVREGIVKPVASRSVEVKSVAHAEPNSR
ncbi:MAG: hypothetical protein MUC88_23710 [Planctomycetes bacterium]|jgi:hypothetical protein|nr:hypothetical protein [Planctomycetota bacterium]